MIDEFLKENFSSEITVCKKHIHRFIRKCFLMNVLKRFSKNGDIWNYAYSLEYAKKNIFINML